MVKKVFICIHLFLRSKKHCFGLVEHRSPFPYWLQSNQETNKYSSLWTSGCYFHVKALGTSSNNTVGTFCPLPYKQLVLWTDGCYLHIKTLVETTQLSIKTTQVTHTKYDRWSLYRSKIVLKLKHWVRICVVFIDNISLYRSDSYFTVPISYRIWNCKCYCQNVEVNAKLHVT